MVATAALPFHFVRQEPNSQQLTETKFIDQAMDHLRGHPLTCLLDSAGPIHKRSNRIILSGEPLGLFLQKRGSWQFWDGNGQCSLEWDTERFSRWVESFHHLELGPAGPMLFPLLSYETFDQFSSTRNHPIWPDIQSVWLLTQNSYQYNRRTQTLLYPKQQASRAHSNWHLPNKPNPEVPSTGWRENQASYRRKIHAVKRDIFEGNYYQANLSQRFLGETDQDPLETYTKMRRMNPSPFMGVFRWGSLWVISGSPERLLDKHGQIITTRPIAGTQPRSSDQCENLAALHHLQTSEKERAEHLMLVDLARNDLGKIALAGTVRVPEFAIIESYSHVHHLVSQVEAQLRPNISVIEVIQALFPGGTITGAPKIACMAQLAQLEGEARGPYTGSLGYIDTHGAMDLNILIRTLIQRDRRICFHAGGGIVADSQDDAEYLETRHKAAALMEALCLSV